MRKEFKTFSGKLITVGVRDVSLCLQRGELFALLGQNGAGKTTLMNMLSGLIRSTSGDALIMGYSVQSQMSVIRKKIGVCPQHDILFDELTPRNHIELYAGLKGVAQDEWDVLVNERLQAVRLLSVADSPVSSFSGGMKRRLSVMLATLGDPSVCYLDEPTTGMDPINRRHVWNFIEQFKLDRVIILTTHSMEEAEVLGDRLGIMAHGRLRAIGSPAAIKYRFGAGYKVSIVTDPSVINDVKYEVKQAAPFAMLEDDNAGALLYNIPDKNIGQVGKFVKYLNQDPRGLFKAWGISQDTLESVFLKIIRDAAAEDMK